MNIPRCALRVGSIRLVLRGLTTSYLSSFYLFFELKRGCLFWNAKDAEVYPQNQGRHCLGPHRDLAGNALIAANPWNRYTVSALFVEDAFRKAPHRDSGHGGRGFFICPERKTNKSLLSTVDQSI
jgi:hypothetical protein